MSDFDYLIDNYGKNSFKENSLGTLLNNKAYNLILLKELSLLIMLDYKNKCISKDLINYRLNNVSKIVKCSNAFFE